jgi:hypothetical protein
MKVGNVVQIPFVHKKGKIKAGGAKGIVVETRGHWPHKEVLVEWWNLYDNTPTWESTKRLTTWIEGIT